MINNLENRRERWGHPCAWGPIGRHDLTDSLPYPFEDAGIGEIFEGKDVLEIGPGAGRQFERLCGCTKSYYLCDICQSVLDQPLFAISNGKFLVEDWGQYLGQLFDVVHFWYVIHHIRQDELRNFFAFLSRHLRNGGRIAFNNPEPINVQGDPAGDGCGTTYTDPEIIGAAVEGLSLEILSVTSIQKKSTGHVFLLGKTA